MDHNSNLKKWITPGGIQGISVTSINISPGNEYLAAGYDNGWVKIFDLKKAAQIPPDLPIHSESILSLTFFPGTKPRIVSSGNEGTIKCSELTISSNKVTANSVVLLKSFKTYSLCPILDPLLIAASDFDSVKMMTVVPEGKVAWEFRRPEKVPRAVSYLSFRKVTTGTGKAPVSSLLAVGWHNTILLLRIQDISIYDLVGSYTVSEPINSLGWIEDGVLIVLKGNTNLELLYAKAFMSSSVCKKSNTPPFFESYDIPYSKLCKRIIPSLFEAASTLQHSYHQSIVVRNAKVFCLTTDSLIRGSLRMWFDLLNYLAGNKGFLKTVAFAYNMYMGRIKGFAALPESAKDREKDLKDWVRAFMEGFFLQAIISQPEDLTPENVQLGIEIWIKFEGYNFLLQDLYGHFAANKKEEFYIETIEPFLMSGCFKCVTAPTNFMKSVIKHYRKANNLQKLENAIISLIPSEADFDLISITCQECGLYSAYIYVCTLGNDVLKYEDPLILMWSKINYGQLPADNFGIQDLENPTAEVLDSATYLKYKMLWYIYLCLQKEKYLGKPLSSLWPEVVSLVLHCIVREGILKELVRFDPKSTFNKVLLQIFENDELRQIVSKPELYDKKRSISQVAHFHYKILIDTLAKIANELKGNQEVFDHYIRFLGKGSAAPNIQIPPIVFLDAAKLLSYYPKENTDEGESELLVLSLLERLRTLSPTQLAELKKEFQNTSYIEISLFLHEQSLEYVKALELHIFYRPQRVFKWLKKLYSKLPENSTTYTLFKSAVSDNLDKLVHFNFHSTIIQIDHNKSGTSRKIVDDMVKGRIHGSNRKAKQIP
eukprot:TRINITY_DN1936_c0_g1_i1.p1 TRINITY_DN1936_c0_g1~~TRINITY_DN1936_c0_g1_i1.p1  ORF type:complete len:827 (+),score=60.39 TRINITY_DN1936_c0_g1_i1:534-3014(+)